MKTITKIFSLGLLLLSGVGFAVVSNSKETKVEEASAYTSPSTYYSTVSGTGSTLLSSINTKINQNLTRIAYDNLKTNAYPYTDVRADGKIYDIYSDNTNYVPGSAFASSYNNVGDGYNREHTIPQSWWGGGTTLQGCDLYIVLPSDAKANGMRSNYPYGETTSGTSYKLANDPSGNRLGTSTSTQYVTGTVFEPFDSRKGDLARIYFYAVAMYLNDGCKNGKVTNWTDGEGASVFSSSGNNGFVQKYLNMLLKWHQEDPVSEWEITRNNNGEERQGNRNPFVDHPSWVDLVWGGTYPSTGTNYENTNGGTASVVNGVISGGSSTPTVNSVTVSPSSLSLNLTNNTTGNLTATVSVSNGAAQTVSWTSNNTSVATVSSSGVVTAIAVGTATITATSTADNTKKGTCTVTVSSSGSGGGSGSQRIVSKSDSTYYEAGAIYPTGTTTSGSCDCDAFSVSWLKNSGNNIVYTYSELRIYQYHSFTITPKTGYSITSIVITANSNEYANAIGGSSLTNCTKSTSGSTVTLTPTSVSSAVGFTQSAQSRVNYIVVNYSGGSSTPTEPTSISASVSKTYYVGDTISKSDITIKDNLNNSITDFTFSNYQFTYEDGPSGGTTQNKQFTITYSNMSTTLTIPVSRKAYTAPNTSTSTYTSTSFSSLTSSYTENQSITISGMAFLVNGYYYSKDSKLSLSNGKTSAPGSIKNTTAYSTGITNVSVTGASPDIQLSVNGTSWVDLSDATTTSVNYYYFKAFYKNTAQSSYINIDSITVTLKSAETTSNVANYIMYEDTSNQCTTKFNVAKAQFENLSKSDRATFMTSEDYVLSTARSRLQAWASHEGKSITLTNGDYVIASNSGISLAIKTNNDTTSIVTIIVSLLSITALGGFLFIKHKKEER